MISVHHIVLLLSAMSLFTFHIVSNATDNINLNRVLTENETMISSGGRFELGFFSPGNSTNRYVGIWYKKVSVRTVLWVANPENPLTNTSGLLKLMQPGVLVLEDEAGAEIWSTNASHTRIMLNPVARLLDSGNLVVKDANDGNEDNLHWQSFNHPTDTLLPGMKLGWNYVTNQEVYLSSWKGSEDPAQGNYSYHCDPTGYPQNIVRVDGAVSYRTGAWNGIGFSGQPYLRSQFFYQHNVVISETEVYYHYLLLNSTMISRLTLNWDGSLALSIWNDRTNIWTIYQRSPTDQCDLYGVCGEYSSCDILRTSMCGCLGGFVPIRPNSWIRRDWSYGCVRKDQFDCGKGDRFLIYSGIKLPDTRDSWFNESITLEECKRLCSMDCSCMAYANLDIRNGGSGCLIWYNQLVDLRYLLPEITAQSAEGQEQVVYVRMGSSNSDTKPSIIVIASMSTIAGLVLTGVGLMLCAWRRKTKGQRRETGGQQLGYLVANRSDARHNQDLELPLFELHTIAKATDDFSIDHKLGQGGFGPVYKGILRDGQEIAVKRLSKTSYQGVDEFMNEVICIAKLQHRNLVKLLGCCTEGEENILVYEYMCNKSLDSILFDEAKSSLLDWPKRMHIINGIARGLLYLHQDSSLRIIHRDLKASNVLLDTDMNPKISDFGLARSFGGTRLERTHTEFGYMAPEYAGDGLFSVKSDVFSFGVLVLEIVTGKRNRGSFTHMDQYLNLLGHAWILYREGRSLELVDPGLGSSHNIAEVTRSVQVGLLCVQQCPEDRPNMSSVVWMLANKGVLPQAKQPGFFTGNNIRNDETPVSSNPACSTNEMSITLLEGR